MDTAAVNLTHLTVIENMFHPLTVKVFKSPDEFTTNSAFLDAHLWLVEEATIYKVTTKVMHEYVCFRLRYCLSDASSYILTERSAHHGKHAFAFASSSRHASRRSMSPGPGSSIASFDAVQEASDQIVTASTYEELMRGIPTRPVYKLCSLSYTHLQQFTDCTGGPSLEVPSAADLGLLLKVIHSRQRQYRLFSAQCYWYAYTVYESLFRLFPDAQQFTYSNDRGMFRGMEIPKVDSVDAVVHEFRQCDPYFKADLERERRHYEGSDPLQAEIDAVKANMQELEAENVRLRALLARQQLQTSILQILQLFSRAQREEVGRSPFGG